MFFCVLVFICVVALSSEFSAFSEKTLLCSSEYASIWYSYEGPVYYLSATASHCSPNMELNTLNYTITPMFTVASAGYYARIYFKNQLWFEYTQPNVPCEDVKICYITKGETLHDTCQFHMKKKILFLSQGEYYIYMDVNIVDDTQRTLTLHFNITVQVKNTGRNKDIFQQLGGL